MHYEFVNIASLCTWFNILFPFLKKEIAKSRGCKQGTPHLSVTNWGTVPASVLFPGELYRHFFRKEEQTQSDRHRLKREGLMFLCVSDNGEK